MSPCQHFAFEKNPPYTLTPKDLDKQLFFIVDNGEAGRCFLCFINRKANGGYSRFIS